MNKEKEAIKLANQASYLLSQSFTTFQHIYQTIVNLNKDQIAIFHREAEGSIRQYTYLQYDNTSKSVAKKLSILLANVNRKKDLVVALKLRNTPAWCFIFWGLLMNGCRPLLIDAKLSKENTDNLLKSVNAIAIITDDRNTYDILTIVKDDINDISENLNFIPDWADEVIFCSSGTTGNIKLVVYNGLNMVHQLNASKNMPNENLNIIYSSKIEPLRIIALIPFHHIFAFVAIFMWYSFYAATLIFTDYNDPITLVKDVRELKVTHIYHVPLFYEVVAKNFLNKLDEETKEKVNSLIRANLGRERHWRFITKRIEKKVKNALFGTQIRYLISGGGSLEESVSETINGLGYPLYNGYGMTEIGVTSVELSPDPIIRLKRSIGRPLFNVRYRIDKKTNELFVKSPITHIKEIIDGKEKETKLDDRGYFATGDIASIDEDHRYYLRGRLKEVMIASNGENVYPDEIEAHFKKIKGIINLAVFSTSGKIILVVYSNEDIYDQLVDNNKLLPIHKQANDIILTKDPLPLSSSMKVKRFLVKDNYKNGLYSSKKKKKTKKVDILAGYDQDARRNVTNKLNDIFKTILFRQDDIDGDAHWINDLHSDSMTYITLISEIEKNFVIKIPLEKYGQLTTLNEFAKELLDSGCK